MKEKKNNNSSGDDGSREIGSEEERKIYKEYLIEKYSKEYNKNAFYREISEEKEKLEKEKNELLNWASSLERERNNLVNETKILTKIVNFLFDFVPEDIQNKIKNWVSIPDEPTSEEEINTALEENAEDEEEY